MNASTPDPDRAAGAAALDSFLASHPDAEPRVREILEKHLGKLGITTYRNAYLSLQSYMEDVNLLGFIDYVFQANQADRLQEVGQYASPQVMNFLRGIISLYGPELARAYLILDERPNDWNQFTREVYYDQIKEAYYIVIRVAKNNGEESVIEGNASSMLELTTNMLRTLLSVPVRDAFVAATVDPFMKEANDFLAFLQPPSQEPESPAGQ